jgi:biopolymer transport protein ExbD
MLYSFGDCVVKGTNNCIQSDKVMEYFQGRVLVINPAMTSITTAVSDKHRAGSRRRAGHQLKIDMTPMVDLGFLLISFFVITAELARPTTMDLIMPKDRGQPSELGESSALTVLLDNDRLFYYHGKWEEALKNNAIIQTSFSGSTGLRKIIGEKQRQLDMSAKNKEGRNGLMLLIKPGDRAAYKNIVDLLDEATISMVKKYAIIRLSEQEKDWLLSN